MCQASSLARRMVMINTVMHSIRQCARVYINHLYALLLHLFITLVARTFSKNQPKKKHSMIIHGVFRCHHCLKPLVAILWIFLICLMLLLYDQQIPKERNVCLCFFSRKTAVVPHVGRCRLCAPDTIPKRISKNRMLVAVVATAVPIG